MLRGTWYQLSGTEYIPVRSLLVPVVRVCFGSGLLQFVLDTCCADCVLHLLFNTVLSAVTHTRQIIGYHMPNATACSVISTRTVHYSKQWYGLIVQTVYELVLIIRLDAFAGLIESQYWQQYIKCHQIKSLQALLTLRTEHSLQREHWVKSKHMYLIRGSVGAYALFLPIRRRIKKNENKIVHGLHLLTAVHTLFHYPNPNPNCIPVHLLSGNRVPNRIRSGRDRGRGVDQLKSGCGLLTTPVQTFQPYNTKTL